MTPKTHEDYGASINLADAEPVEDPTSELSADYYKPLAEDVAQLTRTSPKAIIFWTTKTSGAVGTAVRTRTQWGDGVGQLPTIARSGAGVYTLTYPSEMADGYGEDETVLFFAAHSDVASLTVDGTVKSTVSGAVVSCQIYDDTGVASDLTPDTTEICTFIY